MITANKRRISRYGNKKQKTQCSAHHTGDGGRKGFDRAENGLIVAEVKKILHDIWLSERQLLLKMRF